MIVLTITTWEGRRYTGTVVASAEGTTCLHLNDPRIYPAAAGQKPIFIAIAHRSIREMY